MIQYENIFKVYRTLYARTFDTETKKSTIRKVKPKLSFFIKDNSSQDTGFISALTKEPLKELTFTSEKDYRDSIKMYKDTDVSVYGNKSIEHSYIRENYREPLKSNHNFHTWYIDIETAVDIDDPYHDKKLDWKPTGSERSAKAIITSIQIFDSNSKEFYIFGLNKDWKNHSQFKSEYGEIKYIKPKNEETMLKAFLKLLKKRNPTLLVGFNSFGYDFPYLTNRIIRVLDKREDLYVSDKFGNWLFNRDCLSGAYVTQLSPVGVIGHKSKENKFGNIVDIFDWNGLFLEDYAELLIKYANEPLPDNTLNTIAEFWLGEGKVTHDAFDDYGAWYRGDYEHYIYNKKTEDDEMDLLYLKLINKDTYTKELDNRFQELSYDLFIGYSIVDVSLLVQLEEKLKLIQLAKMIAYTTGVNYPDVSGTLKQWASFMHNKYMDEGMILPMESRFDKVDSVLLEHALKMDDLPKERKELYKRLYNGFNEKGETLRGQKFAGGIARATGKMWRWIYYLDFKSLYPSALQWANIGLDTLILPKDLPKELLDLRAKYAIYYPKDTSAEDLLKYDLEYTQNVVFNEKNRNYINSILTKHNVTMTPNGMFFRKDKRSILSKSSGYLIDQRKIHKKNLSKARKLIKEMKELDNYDIDEFNKQKTIEEEEDIYQLGIKTLNNAMYGSLSVESNPFAGQIEYFSVAITSAARVGNLSISQAQNMLIDKILKVEPKETKYGMLTNLDRIAIIQTDSKVVSMDDIFIKKFGEDYETKKTFDELTDLTLKYVDKYALPEARRVLDEYYAFAQNAYLPEKLEEENESVADVFLSIAPMKHAFRYAYKDGLQYRKEENKIKVTGLSMIGKSTPKYHRGELKDALSVLINADFQEVGKFADRVQKETRTKDPKEISINVGVNSLDYPWDETAGKFRRWIHDKNKFLTAPVNSRGALVHNKFIQDYNIPVKEIEAGDKISFVYMKMPNILNSNVFAFKDERVFEYKNLEEYIDYQTMYEKGFRAGIDLIIEPLGWDITPKENLIDEDEW